MRRQDKAWTEDDGRALLARAAVVHLAGVLPDGAPCLRAVHTVDVDGALMLHSAPEGEKLGLVGRQVVLTAHEVIAEVPSTAFHPERACPATTLYRSATGHGVLREVTDPDRKAAALMALMRRLQPEGGYRPIVASDPMYTRAVDGVAVLEVAELRVVGKIADTRRYAPRVRGRVLEALWRRGGPGDAVAVDVLARAAAPDPWPAFLDAPHGLTLRCAPDASLAPAAAALVAGEYWNVGVDPDRIAAAHAASPAWVAALDGDAVIATARAIGDGAKLAYVMDVAVRADWRGRGVGTRLLRLLLDHPAVRGARKIALHTRDAMPVYERLGFTRITHPAWRVELQLTP